MNTNKALNNFNLSDICAEASNRFDNAKNNINDYMKEHRKPIAVTIGMTMPETLGYGFYQYPMETSFAAAGLVLGTGILKDNKFAKWLGAITLSGLTINSAPIVGYMAGGAVVGGIAGVFGGAIAGMCFGLTTGIASRIIDSSSKEKVPGSKHSKAEDLGVDVGIKTTIAGVLLGACFGTIKSVDVYDKDQALKAKQRTTLVIPTANQNNFGECAEDLTTQNSRVMTWSNAMALKV